MKESTVEQYLVERVEALGGEVRKVRWEGRSKAPDRVVMLPTGKLNWLGVSCIWVELKNPDTIKTFPANAHERAQDREHERMRKCGQMVLVIGTKRQVDGTFA